jgi:hypothetical protein
LTFSLIFYGFLFYLLTTMLICRVMFWVVMIKGS